MGADLRPNGHCVRSLRTAEIHSVDIPIDNRANITRSSLHNNGARTAVDFYRNNDTRSLLRKKDCQLRRMSTLMPRNEGREFFIRRGKPGNNTLLPAAAQSGFE